MIFLQYLRDDEGRFFMVSNCKAINMELNGRQLSGKPTSKGMYMVKVGNRLTRKIVVSQQGSSIGNGGFYKLRGKGDKATEIM